MRKRGAVAIGLLAVALLSTAWISRDPECPLPPHPQGNYQAVSALREELNDYTAVLVSSGRFIAVVPDDAALNCYLILYDNEIP